MGPEYWRSFSNFEKHVLDIKWIAIASEKLQVLDFKSSSTRKF